MRQCGKLSCRWKIEICAWIASLLKWAKKTKLPQTALSRFSGKSLNLVCFHAIRFVRAAQFIGIPNIKNDRSSVSRVRLLASHRTNKKTKAKTKKKRKENARRKSFILSVEFWLIEERNILFLLKEATCAPASTTPHNFWGEDATNLAVNALFTLVFLLALSWVRFILIPQNLNCACLHMELGDRFAGL